MCLRDVLVLVSMMSGAQNSGALRRDFTDASETFGRKGRIRSFQLLLLFTPIAPNPIVFRAIKP